MKYVIFLFILFTSLLLAVEEPIMQSESYEISTRTKTKARGFERDVYKGKAARLAHTGLNALIHVAAYKLKISGHQSDGIRLLKEWEEQYSMEYLGWMEDSRHIGDHPPVSAWLNEQLMKLYLILGPSAMRMTRLSDLVTFNSTPRVIFQCIDSVDLAEYGLHWIEDPFVDVGGLAPVTAFWVSSAACLGASFSSGFLFCGPISAGVEFLVRQFAAPNTNEFMWETFCKK